jgi:hypothetical protein
VVRRGVAALLEQVLHAVAGAPPRALVGGGKNAGLGVRARCHGGRQQDRGRVERRCLTGRGWRGGLQAVRVPTDDAQRFGPQVVAVPPHDPGSPLTKEVFGVVRGQLRQDLGTRSGRHWV